MTLRLTCQPVLSAMLLGPQEEFGLKASRSLGHRLPLLEKKTLKRQKGGSRDRDLMAAQRRRQKRSPSSSTVTLARVWRGTRRSPRPAIQ